MTGVVWVCLCGAAHVTIGDRFPRTLTLPYVPRTFTVPVLIPGGRFGIRRWALEEVVE